MEIFFFARVIRAAMVGSDTRNARAMSGGGDPAQQSQRERHLGVVAPAPGGSR